MVTPAARQAYGRVNTDEKGAPVAVAVAPDESKSLQQLSREVTNLTAERNRLRCENYLLIGVVACLATFVLVSTFFLKKQE